MNSENNSAEQGIIDRRTFVKAISAASAGLALGCAHRPGATTKPAVAAMPAPTGPPRRFAIVGLGSRSQMYQNAIQGEYKAYAELVGICDLNPGRLDLAQRTS